MKLYATMIALVFVLMIVLSVLSAVNLCAPDTPSITDPAPVTTTTAPAHTTSAAITTTTTTTETTTTEPEVVEPEIDPSWAQRWEEYPKATEIWLIMKEFGWSDAACAGIMGNIMQECGGNTLKHIDETRYNSTGTHFGLCQWSAKYYPDIQPKDGHIPTIREQMEFLRLTIREYNGHGFSYGFTEEFLQLAASPEGVAKIFCERYERPEVSSDRRQELAREAYNYFTSHEVIKT